MTKHIIALALSALAVAGCSSTDGGRSSLGEAGSSFGSGFSRSNDINGTQRRMDVYGGATSPVLPTIGAPGFGK